MRDLAESRRRQDSRELASDSEESSSGLFMKSRTRQREFGFMGWGGKRRGAGRKPKGERAGVSHAKRPKLAARFPVSITLRLLPGLRTLRENGTHERIRELLAASTTESFRVIEYSVLSNHVHFLAESSDERALSRAMLGLVSRLARALNRMWKRAGQVFGDRYHARILETPREVRSALNYVLQNARKHGAWRARWPDAYSSGPSFEGWKDLHTIRTTTRAADSTLASWAVRARTWLLSVGWRRHGPIGVLEAPSSG